MLKAITMRIAACAFVLVLASGCVLFGPSCKDREQNYDIRYASVFYEFEMDLVRVMEDNGWDCTTNGRIFNAFGNEIGVRYRCTICD